MSQNSIWAWTRVTDRGESSADDKRPVCNKMPRQTFSRLRRRLHQCTSNCTSSCRCRSQATPLPSQASAAPMTTPVFHLPSPLDSFFSPSVRKSARYPAWKFRRGSSVAPDPDAAVSPTAHNSYAVWREQLLSRPKQTRSTAQCSVWLNVMRQQRYRTTKLRLTLKWLKLAAGRNMMQGDTAGAQVSRRKLPRSQLSATEGRVLSDFVATWINI